MGLETRHISSPWYYYYYYILLYTTNYYLNTVAGSDDAGPLAPPMSLEDSLVVLRELVLLLGREENTPMSHEDSLVVLGAWGWCCPWKGKKAHQQVFKTRWWC